MELSFEPACDDWKERAAGIGAGLLTVLPKGRIKGTVRYAEIEMQRGECVGLLAGVAAVFLGILILVMIKPI